MNENPYTAPESQSAPSGGQVWRARLLNAIGVLIFLGVMLALFSPLYRGPSFSRGTARRAQCINNSRPTEGLPI